MIQALFDKVLIKLHDEESVTKSGIILTKKQDNFIRGVVLSIGKKVTDVTVGETVILDKNAGTDIQIDGQKHLIVSCKKIIGAI